MGRVWALLALGLSLSGCGVAETGTAAAANSAAAAQQAAQARGVQQQVKEQIDSAFRQDADQRRDSEAQEH